MSKSIRAGRAFIKLSEPKPMTPSDRERVLTLKEATRGLNPKGYVSIRVEDVDFLTNAVMESTPEPTETPEKPDIDGGFTTEAAKEPNE